MQRCGGAVGPLLTLEGTLAYSLRVDASSRAKTLLASFLACMCVSDGEAQNSSPGERQDSDLRATFEPGFGFVLPENPTPYAVRLDLEGDRLLRGRLVLSVFREDGTPLYVLRSEEMVLNSTSREVTGTLPILPNVCFLSGPPRISIGITFETSQGRRIELGAPSMFLFTGTRALSPLGYRWRAKPFGVIHSPSSSPPGRSEGLAAMQWSSLRREVLSASRANQVLADQFRPETLDRREPRTIEAILSPTRVPASGVYLSSFETVFVQDGISSLSARQQRALGEWVQSGGKLILAVRDQGEEEARAFLSEFVTKRSIGPVDGIGMVTGGMGKVLLIPWDYRPPEEPIENLSEVLLQARSGEIQLPLLKGRYTIYTEEHVKLVDWIWGSDPSPVTRFLARDEEGQPALPWEALVPLGTSAFPVKTIVCAMIFFLLIAGPLEYHVLGWWRRRSLTWLVFPLVAIGCTWLVVSRSNARLGEGTFGAWKEVKSSAESDVSRVINHRLHVAGEHGTVMLPGKDAQFQQWDDFIGFRARMATTGMQEPWTITGSYPIEYEATRRVAKWSPVVTVSRQLTRDRIHDGIPWENFDPWLLDHRDPGAPALLCDRVHRFASKHYPEGRVHIVTMARPSDGVISREFIEKSGWGRTLPAGSMPRHRPYYWNGNRPSPIATAPFEFPGLVSVSHRYPTEIYFCTPCIVDDVRATISFTVRDGTHFTTHTHTYIRSRAR